MNNEHPRADHFDGQFIHTSHALAGAGEVAEWSIAAVLKTASASPPTGVRIPPSPPERFVSHLTTLLIWVAAVGVVFALMWWKGYLLKLRNYLDQTREELRKCTWPTWDELKGSTALMTCTSSAADAHS